jgi:hypothetical protein
MAVIGAGVQRTADVGAGRSAASRRMVVGANVAVSVALAVGITVVLQVMAFNAPGRWDMTSSGINSLTSATERLLGDLDGTVRLTSLYFETELEEEDQPRYRRAVDDLLKLYQSVNRPHVVADWINPIKDHQKLNELMSGLRKIERFAKEFEPHQAVVDGFRKTLYDKLRGVIDGELARLAALGDPLAGGAVSRTIAPVQQALTGLDRRVESTQSRVEALTAAADRVTVTDATDEITALLGELDRLLKDISEYGQKASARATGLTPEQEGYLRELGARLAEVQAEVGALKEKTDALTAPKLDDILSQIGATTNALLVSTDDDAVVLDFETIWPPMQGAQPRGALTFRERAFKGEEKLTSAILRVTHREQTAVVFVRYGGNPLFFGGFMPGMPPAPYATMKTQLEDANFVVHEWDVKSSETPPAIDPPPTKTIYVVLKPTPPRSGPMGQQPQETPISPEQVDRIVSAVKESGRAIFIGGWHPGPFGPIPSTCEFNDHLRAEWGVEVDTSQLLLRTMSIAPGRYVFAQGPVIMSDVEVSEHAIVSGANARRLRLPLCAPLKMPENAPEGVTLAPLVSQPRQDGVWGARDVSKYEAQTTQEYVTKVEGDGEGPFVLAVAAERDKTKVVVVSSAGFAEDGIAFARGVSLGPQGFTLRSLNPGNVSLFVNSLHWLNDNTQFMDLGQPIDAAVLTIKNPATPNRVAALTIVVWPALALACGGVVWWVRRR